MSERKDDIIIGLLVVIIVLQVYGLFLGNTVQTTQDTEWQSYGNQEVIALPEQDTEAPSNEVDAQQALGEAVEPSSATDDPHSGADVPGKPGDKTASGGGVPASAGNK